MSDRCDWPIVVGGCHRSGTSLVRRVLDAHPRIHCGPEVPFFRDFYGDYREDRLAHLRFTRAVRDIVPEDEALDVLGRAFVELHERAARHAGKERWADKAPENVLYTRDWARLLGDEWLFVHVVRNPLDTIASMQGRFPLTLPNALGEQVDLYRTYTEAGLAFCADHPDRSYVLIYETLCERPAEELESLMASLAEHAEPAQLRFNQHAHETGLEDPKVAGTNGVHRDGVGRWRSTLDGGDAEFVLAGTRSLWAAIDPHGRHASALVRGVATGDIPE